MKHSLIIRRGIVWVAGALAAALFMLVIALAALDAGYLRGPFVRFLNSHAERKIQIDGALETHLLSGNPRVIAKRVTIGNPPWTTAGTAAEIEKLTVVLQMPGFNRSFGIQKLQMDGTKLSLIRDSTGHANWQTTNPDEGAESGVPLIRSLSMRAAHLDLDDALRHLRFRGSLSAQDMDSTGPLPPLRIEGVGDLNGRKVSFAINSDPLAVASHERPYGFSFSERSSGSLLTGTGLLLHAFDFAGIDAKFEAAGESLKDLYFLTGTTLIDTGRYRLSGKVSRRGAHTEFSSLAVSSGQSDVLARVVIDTAKGRSTFRADFTSQVIRMADLGARAAGREQDPEDAKLLLSNAKLSPAAVRRGDWRVHFQARRIELGRLALHAVSAGMSIDKGVILVDSLSADLLGGKLTSRLKLDAKTDSPAADVDLKLTDVQIAQWDHKDAGAPPFEGALQARVNVKGHGRSLHEVAASANGPVTAVLTHGSIRTSLAELAGLDLRALGMILGKNKQEAGIRCAVAAFEAHDGTLHAQRLLFDTEPVLITGEGQIHLDSESLDLLLRGRPKSLRMFRLRAPVLVRGTLVHPAIAVQKETMVAQTAGAVAIGVVLTPIAALLAFVDPGLAKDADCAAAIGESRVNSEK
ncbi:MAG: AsmA family protein [Steroidobacteraceae bacterium]